MNPMAVGVGNIRAINQYWLSRLQVLRQKISQKLDASKEQVNHFRLIAELESLYLHNRLSIQNELACIAAIRKTNEDENLKKFLLDRETYLQILKIKLGENFDNLPPVEKIHWAEKVFDIAKKPADLGDDLLRALGDIVKAITETIVNIVVGVCGFIVHAGEGWKAAKDLKKIYDDTDHKLHQRKTRIFTSALTFVLALVGVGISLALIFGAVSIVAVAGLPILSFLVPALLLGMYGLSLWRSAYSLSVLKEQEPIEQAKYEAVSQKNHQRMQELLVEIAKCVDDKKRQELLAKHAQLAAEIEEKKFAYEHLKAERIEAEHELIFGSVEVLGSTLVAIGVLLGTAAIIGGSIASMGALPLVLIIVGAVVGLVTKYLAHRDKANDYSWSQRISNFFKRLFSRKQDEAEPVDKPELSDKLQVDPKAQPPKPPSEQVGTRAELKAESTAAVTAAAETSVSEVSDGSESDVSPRSHQSTLSIEEKLNADPHIINGKISAIDDEEEKDMGLRDLFEPESKRESKPTLTPPEVNPSNRPQIDETPKL